MCRPSHRRTGSHVTEWLERLSRTGGKLITIIRGSDADAARVRLEKVFDSGDPQLLGHFRELATEHLEVITGDIGEPNFGLDDTTWQRLAESVDLIAHVGALVNHVLPYEQLFGPNVVGTAEVIKLAISSRIKPPVDGTDRQIRHRPAALGPAVNARVARRRSNLSGSRADVDRFLAPRDLERAANSRFGHQGVGTPSKINPWRPRARRTRVAMHR